mgnify:CR=1 FL=1
MNDQIVPNKALRDALMEHVSIDIQAAVIPYITSHFTGARVQIVVRLLWDKELVISESQPVEIDLGRG